MFLDKDMIEITLENVKIHISGMHIKIYLCFKQILDLCSVFFVKKKKTYITTNTFYEAA